MPASVEDIAHALRKARESKGLTQLALSEKVGLPQSHISKIESGAVDLQASSLIELARALDLELTLVPRAALPAVQAVSGASEPSDRRIDRLIDREIDIVLKHAQLHATRYPGQKIFLGLTHTLNDLKRIRIPARSADKAVMLLRQVETVLKKLERAASIPEGMRRIRESTSQLSDLSRDLRQFRNLQAHGLSAPSPDRQAVYRLDDDADD
jgi:transcriptional regulator with XRE-family HTH domain